MKNSQLDGTLDTPIAVLDAPVPLVKIRPWGTVTVLEESDRYRINRIEIHPGQSMCLQMHYHRSEHWVIVSGTATVLCGTQTIRLLPKQSTYVPSNTPHKVTNPGVIPLVMIEIQNGEYLGEDDIIRLQDSDHAPTA